MRTAVLAAAVAVLGIAAWAGIGYACGGGGGGGGGGSSASLVWIDPGGAGVPATHTFIACSESGGNTPNLALGASDLGPGDGCQFTASLANVGSEGLKIQQSAAQESTPHGAPAFSSCFSFTVTSGPGAGMIPGGGSVPYTFLVQLLSSATSACEKVVGTVVLTFTGSQACSNHGWSTPPRSWKLGPNVNLKDWNLSGYNLSGYDMAGDNLQGADLQCANLRGTNFGNANLGGANFDYSDLTGACFQGASLSGASLVDTTLSGATFKGGSLPNVDLDGAIVTGFSYETTSFNGANLDGLNLEDVFATGWMSASGATTTGAINVASCVATSGTAAYCDLL